MHGLDWYDYGARHYEPVLSRFTTPDPLAEKYYSISPYAYCAGNPVMFVDPDGRDIWEVNKDDGKVKWKEKSETHSLVAYDKDGNKTSLNVENRAILDQLTDNRTDYNGHYAVSTDDEIGSVFTFLAEKTNVEWGLTSFNNGEFVLSTSNKEGEVSQVTNMSGYAEENMKSKIHSHPGEDGTKGASHKTGADMNKIIRLAYQFVDKGIYNNKQFPKHFVYHPFSKNIYQYTPDENSLHIGNTKTQRNILKTIQSKGTFSPTFKRK